MNMTEDDVLKRGDTLAGHCAGGGVLENQLANVLAHLKRHQSPRATLQLLKALPKSPFGKRTKKTREQYEALERHVALALASVSSWQDAARIVGWAKRLFPIYKSRSH